MSLMIFRTQFFRLGFGQGIYQLYVNNILYTILSGKYYRFYFLKKYNHISESPWATVIITYLLDFRSKIGKYYKMRASLRQNWFNIHFSEHNDPLTTKKHRFSFEFIWSQNTNKILLDNQTSGLYFTGFTGCKQH